MLRLKKKQNESQPEQGGTETDKTNEEGKQNVFSINRKRKRKRRVKPAALRAQKGMNSNAFMKNLF